jgi:lysophospholipase L1-like esterase
MAGTPRLVEAGLVAGGVVVALALAESAARLLPIPGGFHADVVAFAAAAVEPDPARSHRLKPGAAVTVGGVEYRVSSIGTRGDEPVEPRGDRLRVIAVGDSVTLGWGVPEDAAWPAVVRRSLEAAGRPAEVINAGVLGYGIREDAAWVEELDRRLRPDLVLVGYYPNDPEDAETATRSSGPSWSRLWTLAYPRLRALGLKLGLASDASAAYRSLHEPGTESWARAENAIGRIGRYCREAGVPCVLVLLPGLVGPPDALADAWRRVAVTATAAGLEVIDLNPLVAGVPPETLWVAPDDAHPDADTHGRYGRAVAAWLVESGRLRRR